MSCLHVSHKRAVRRTVTSGQSVALGGVFSLVCLRYADLGHVTRVRRCGGCFGVSSNAGTFYPGWGCSGDVVSAVIQEMRERMFARGNVGQVPRVVC